MLDARAVQENESLWPTATTPVLVSRPLNPNHHAKRLSLYGDDYWDFTPAMFEAHQTATGYDFAGMPVSFKHVAKRYVWLQLNHPDPPRLRTTTPARLAVHTIREGTGNIKPFFAFLERQGVRQLSEVTPHHLDTFLAAIKDDSISTQKRQKEAYEVRRLWVYRHLLPVEDRLPDAPPWEGERTRDLVGQRDYNEENATPRIPDEIMTPLLCWAIRFVEDFAEDIVAARKEYIELCNGTADGRRAARSQRTQLSNRGPIREEGGRIRRDLIALLESYRQRAKPLPGRRNEAGDLVVDYEYLARLVFSNGFRVKRYGDLLRHGSRDA